jgi:hypothetical protein
MRVLSVLTPERFSDESIKACKAMCIKQDASDFKLEDAVFDSAVPGLKLKVTYCPTKGYGLKAMGSASEGTVIGVCTGALLPELTEDLVQDGGDESTWSAQARSMYDFNLYEGNIGLPDGAAVFAATHTTVMVLVNSPSPGQKHNLCFIESPDHTTLLFVACRDIKSGDELLVKYSVEDTADEHTAFEDPMALAVVSNEEPGASGHGVVPRAVQEYFAGTRMPRLMSVSANTRFNMYPVFGKNRQMKNMLYWPDKGNLYIDTCGAGVVTTTIWGVKDNERMRVRLRDGTFVPITSLPPIRAPVL